MGPLKGYLCRVLAIRRSDVTVKLDSKQKVLTGLSTLIHYSQNCTLPYRIDLIYVPYLAVHVYTLTFYTVQLKVSTYQRFKRETPSCPPGNLHNQEQSVKIYPIRNNSSNMPILFF